MAAEIKRFRPSLVRSQTDYETAPIRVFSAAMGFETRGRSQRMAELRRHLGRLNTWEEANFETATPVVGYWKWLAKRTTALGR